MKSYEQVASMIWTSPDELDEQEIESYLQVAEVQAALDRDNFFALVTLDGGVEEASAA